MGKNISQRVAVEGRILRERRGQEGFGYDPLFFVPEFARTMAELNLVQKNKLSHRAQAFHKMIPIIKDLVRHGSKSRGTMPSVRPNSV